MRRHAIRVLILLAMIGPAVPAIAYHNTGNDDFRRQRFGDPLDIGNAYYPLVPGTQLILEGQNEDGRLEITVTDVVQRINGVGSLGVRELDLHDPTPEFPTPTWIPAEDEITFLAQDRRDNVWRLAEYPEEFDIDENEGMFLSAPST